ncbi:lytic polysaccharide monooxygenase [Aaosphaeria arxii CBS 175.79]|uniref:Lytic polysaccharide monooxygenase n=1 Tax=Aaosphaeria arxii CBS 175.79 TaxID=1450172 RepID=A0A6A5XDQ2_9PLEO|nr:lytic polysaccharide monooxygenase [Aaosphaeria arxii CBS 175.79]KAF2010946.1 lytic polysaccharide monooxygenase [Aaosphaeria arxii CBS 175.79]
MYMTLAVMALMGAAHAHMHLQFPPTLRGDNNPFTKQVDPKLNYPYGCCGMEPLDTCHGHLDALDTDEGQSVVTWKAGQTANFTLSGHRIRSEIENPEGGTHYGGSCQIGFSVDGGKTFKIASTWNGNCPLREGSQDPSTQKFDFTVPADMPSGKAVFAWTWINREKEFNMNCASVTITGGKSESPKGPQQSASPTKPQQSATPTPPSSQPPNQQYTLSGCTCECPSDSWTKGCECYDCTSPKTKRHLVARQALDLHKRRLQSFASRNTNARRVVAFAQRGNMMINPSGCDLPGNPNEVEFDPAGGEIHEGDGEYNLAPLQC